MIRTRTLWAILRRCDNVLDGARQWLDGDPDHVTRTKLFETRRAAREHIQLAYGYFAERPDLYAEPHGWRMPQAVRVVVSVEASV
jgi:hypothetical protein